MGQYLIVANQTLGGERLDQAVRERIDRGASEFYVLVPMTEPEHESKSWTGGFFAPDDVRADAAQAAVEEEARLRESLVDQAVNVAEDRLRQMIKKVQAAGGQVEGSVGAFDPADAVEEVLNDRSFDEIIISTLPAGISRWLKLDLPSRVERMTEIPVTTIEAEESPAG
jgi:cell pole-organizing protein PopZ